MLNVLKSTKGFTIVELLGVITLLLIIMTIATPSITSLIGRTGNKVLEEKKKLLIAGAREYVEDNYNNITSNTCYIKVETLAQKGFIIPDAGNYLTDSDGNNITGSIKYVYNTTTKKDTYTYQTTVGSPLCP